MALLCGNHVAEKCDDQLRPYARSLIRPLSRNMTSLVQTTEVLYHNDKETCYH